MEIIHRKKRRQFQLLDNNHKKIGYIEYEPDENDALCATHTVVFPAHEGQGYAAMLLDALASYAKEENQKIVPVCPYVVAAFKRYPEKYADVIES